MKRGVYLFLIFSASVLRLFLLQRRPANFLRRSHRRSHFPDDNSGCQRRETRPQRQRRAHSHRGRHPGENGVSKFVTKPAEKSPRYWRAKITATGNIGDLSAITAEFAIVF